MEERLKQDSRLPLTSFSLLIVNTRKETFKILKEIKVWENKRIRL